MEDAIGDGFGFLCFDSKFDAEKKRIQGLWWKLWRFYEITRVWNKGDKIQASYPDESYAHSRKQLEKRFGSKLHANKLAFKIFVSII